ncbi:uncharacterized protein FOMMEDRAFT_76006 [Fomitiporia mediterranea MF3/22]|uniref:uncharacterized protein n=1 Tax=Fomitiporia mediterranea (strain MF3/22) TaxID=694068 RepID=UPI000440876C|nr:uncharacterized protein FOMMEDRAFT_76006 [Fomitiporia mediterranea MF3/22]EJD06844.1 hypothetical protein FOMMEDRAFT_76006 [Fomitiporia mediterranea MF3/22]
MASLQTAHRSTPGTPRKRRQGQRTVTRTIYIATNGASPRKPPPRTKASSATRLPGPPLVSGEEIHTAFTHGTRSSAKYIYDVVTSTLSLLKWPLVLLLTMWTITIIISALSATVRSAFSPLCVIPGVSRFDICATRKLQTGNIKEPQHAEYPMMVEVQSKTFEQLLDESVGSTSVALDIKKAEMATADLVILVRMSDLRGKDHLATALGSFVDDARETARGLQKLNAKISGSVDNILAISDFALQTIEGRSTEKSSLMKYIWPFNSNTSNKELLASTFSQSLSVLSSSLERLILSAEASLDSLNKLEEQLNTIHGIVSREDNTLSVENAELLAALWTRLGGNRAKVVRFASNLQLLKELGGYRAQALARVVAALQALQELSANMEELRERASTPELAGDEIPVEVHARAIRSGVDRLNEGRLRAKRLEEEAVNRVLGLDAD